MESVYEHRVATVRAWCRAFNARDYATLPELFHPDARFESTALAPAGTSYSGPAGVRSLVEAVDARFPEIHARILGTDELGRGVLATIEYSTGASEGERMQAAALYEFDGDLIRRGRTFNNEDDARVAAAEVLHDEFRTLFDSALEAILLVDAAGAIRDLNESACTLFATDREPVIGRPLGEFLRPDCRDAWLSAWDELRREGQVTGQAVVVAGSGEQIPVDVRARAYYRGGMHLVLMGARPELPPRVVAQDRVLSPREREVFRMLALGFNAPEIAERLFLSPATVRTHVQNGVAKLGAKTRVQAVAMALTKDEISL